jgi:dephospho-CoA kinase
MSKSQVVWVSGYPSTGKTFIGDYLASKGWTHVDGDAGQQQSQGPLRDKWNKLCQVFFDISQNKPVQE